MVSCIKWRCGAVGFVLIAAVSTGEGAELPDAKSASLTGTNAAALMAAPIVSVISSGSVGGGNRTTPSLEVARSEIGRLPAPKTIDQRGGLAGMVAARRKRPSELWQLVNPFAPASYGNAGVSYFAIQPSVRDGAGPVRPAVSDYGPWEPAGLFFNLHW